MINNVYSIENDIQDKYKALEHHIKQFNEYEKNIIEKISKLNEKIEYFEQQKCLSGNKHIYEKINLINQHISLLEKEAKDTADFRKNLRAQLREKLDNKPLTFSQKMTNYVSSFKITLGISSPEGEKLDWLNHHINKLDHSHQLSNNLIKFIDDTMRFSNRITIDISIDNQVFNLKNQLKNNIDYIKTKLKEINKHKKLKEKMGIANKLIDQLKHEESILKKLENREFLNNKERDNIKEELSLINLNVKFITEKAKNQVKALEFESSLLTFKENQSPGNRNRVIAIVDELIKYQDDLLPILFRDKGIRQLAIDLLPLCKKADRLVISDTVMIDPIKRQAMKNAIIKNPYHWGRWNDFTTAESHFDERVDAGIDIGASNRRIRKSIKNLFEVERSEKFGKILNEYLVTEWTFIRSINLGQHLLQKSRDRGYISQEVYDTLHISKENIDKIKVFEEIFGEVGLSPAPTQIAINKRTVMKLFLLLNDRAKMDAYLQTIGAETQRFQQTLELRKNHSKEINKSQNIEPITPLEYNDYAIVPVQRGPRHQMLLAQLIERAPKSEEEFIEILNSTLEYIKTQLAKVNASIQ